MCIGTLWVDYGNVQTCEQFYGRQFATKKLQAEKRRLT